VRIAEFLLLGPKGRVGAVETKAKHTQSALGSLGPFVTAEGLENMTATPENLGLRGTSRHITTLNPGRSQSTQLGWLRRRPRTAAMCLIGKWLST
jgi:hypothetical protein